MSEELLKKYKAYYHARAQRYAGNPKFLNAYKAEMELYDAMNSCTTLEDFREKISNLNDRCGIALIKDHYLMELEHYSKHHETVRAMEAKQVLDRIDEYDTILNAVAFVNEVSTANNIRISMDESHPMQFFGDLDQLDNYIIYSNAEVPDNYRHVMQKASQKISEGLSEGVTTVETGNSEWQSNWKLNPDICFEPRHLRHSHLQHEHLKELRYLYSTIVNR